MSISLGLCLLLLGTVEADQVARKVEKDLKSAKYLRVSYSTEGGNLQETMLITDAEMVRSIVATIGVGGHSREPRPGWSRCAGSSSSSRTGR